MIISTILKKWMHSVRKNNRRRRYKLKFGSVGSISFTRRFAFREEEISTADLHAAIAFGEYTIVSHLLILPRVDASLPGPDGKPPLQTAIEYGRVEIVKLLLKMPTISPHGVVDVFNRTPLHIACWKGHKDIVELLLATRPKQNEKSISDNDNEEPLHDLSSTNDNESKLEDHHVSNVTYKNNIQKPSFKETSSSTSLIGQQLFREESNIDEK